MSTQTETTIRPGAEWRRARTSRTSATSSRGDGIAKITIARPEVRNAFRPQTIVEIAVRSSCAREDTTVGVIVLTGEGDLAFCSGGDQRVRGDSGYLHATREQAPRASGAST